MNQNQGRPTTIRDDSDWMSVDRAAAYLDISPNALRILVHRNQVIFYKFNKRLRFKKNDLESLLERGRFDDD